MFKFGNLSTGHSIKVSKGVKILGNLRSQNGRSRKKFGNIGLEGARRIALSEGM